ncbi:MAG: zinc ABC transporter substrate-binding protein [Dongiaceae bacterium]
MGPRTTAASEPPSVVVSIKPVHALVAGVMEGVASPMLLVDGSASPHAYSLKPSQAGALAEADLVVWIGEGFEFFLEAPMESLVPEGHGLELADLSTIALLPVREGGVWDALDHGAGGDTDDAHTDEHSDHDRADEEAGHDHAHDGYDPHIWLDPDHAVAIVAAVAERLRSIDPTNAGLYGDNESALIERLHALDTEMQTMLAPLRDIPFIVFHDAYQYFERHYGLHAAGSITLDPEQKPGAARLAAIRNRLGEGGVVCAFAEPGFDGALLETATEGTDVRLGRLDPEGIALEPGPALYPALIRNLAASLAECLAPTG